MAAAVAVIAIVLDEAQPGPDDEAVLTVILTGLFVCSGGSSIVGLALGFIGCCQGERNLLFAILSVVLNLMVLMGLVVLVCLGVLSEL